MTTVGSFEANTHLARLIDSAHKGNEITITKHGQPIAKLIAADWIHQKKTLQTFKAIDRLRETMETDI